MKKILLLSDTHGHLDNKIIKYAKWADEVWHAGDVGDVGVLKIIEKYSILKGVYGNIDDSKVRRIFPKNQFFKCENISVFITHIGGYPGKYPDEIYKILVKNKPDLFICGHSHILKIINDKKLSLLHINPGAAGLDGFHNKRTIVKFEVNQNKIKNLFVIELGKRSKINVSDQ
ncbi:MAG: YfcE family phosphodiesterase [Flavobacteriaceae bacterium]|nr:YfcE family phosphodiesterase [Flavobacteriaceae bacterium]|tara:strand:- start:2323 stop:2841 length:519 start_codon:yes stop_codon:yes gene_type:complete